MGASDFTRAKAVDILSHVGQQTQHRRQRILLCVQTCNMCNGLHSVPRFQRTGGHRQHTIDVRKTRTCQCIRTIRRHHHATPYFRMAVVVCGTHHIAHDSKISRRWWSTTSSALIGNSIASVDKLGVSVAFYSSSLDTLHNGVKGGQGIEPN